ncbi:4Fe-4S binding protein [Roseococcus sp. SDR]|uniref:4Fe-4S binding protein n=1 Tax=Roseococcus sp. SDR TaxID=2835532 RepID=UPI001BCADA26|nr:4Fe-4S binding protein [Roseococcus sp. SDR]MBS7791278.1 4Fe-4S binding protein [Roseococcus sp. SDR]MBV1846592.1 4Fe-4S binding protein [Roseococcus sp. SDR]
MTASRIAFVCSCEDTMALDGKALAKGCAAQGAELRTAEHLCRSQMDRFLKALGENRPVTVACTQEAPLFTQEAEEVGFDAPLDFVNLREHAGWSSEGEQAGPKMAGLLAAAAQPLPGISLVSMTSQGIALILGRDAVALEAARALSDKLDITVLLTGEEPVTPARRVEFPVLRGRARSATGHLGDFTVVVDDTSAASPASRATYLWGEGKNGTQSRCDVILDLSGRPALFHETRQGYLRADPADPVAVAKAMAAAGELVGTFDKPRFVNFEQGLCAHNRNKKTGCTRCLDLCPTGAITPSGKDWVNVSNEICAGCGACAAVCPTGAIQYALPPADALARRIRAMLLGFAEAGGRDPILLIHDDAHGEALIDALARHGDGLPARVLPIRVNEVSQLDLSLLAGAFAWGAAGLRLLMPARRGHGTEGVFRNLDYLNAALEGLGLGARAAAIETDDPFTLGEALSALKPLRTSWTPESFLPMGAPREVMRQAFRALHGASGATATQVAMPEKAPFGLARVDTEGCTLCLSCTMVCPTSALTANPDTPQLRFLEDACVQCGLCAVTCPEKVITLEPRLNFAPEAARPVVVKEEPPAECPSCGKLFGMKSSVERVKAKLVASGHWMFQDPARLAMLDLCEDCRVTAATNAALDPYATTERPKTKTTEDYLREAERAKKLN